MITEIPRQMGRTPARLIDYLASPRRDQASVLDTNLLGRELRGWAEQIETVARTGKSRGGRFVKHMILSFAPEDPVAKLDLREVVRFYLEKMGYGEAPFLAVLHQDTDHSHVHIVTTPRTWQGAAVSQSWEHLRSVEVAREMERRYGLRPVANPSEARRRPLERSEIQLAARREEKPARQRFQEEIAEAALRSRSFDEFVERAERLGFEVRVWVDDSDQLSGLSFGKGGLAFSGAQLGRDFCGTRFLEAFSLSMSEVSMAEPIPTNEESRAYVPAPSPAPAELPPGRYHVAGVRPEALAEAGRRMTDADVAWVRAGWEPRHIEESRAWLGQENRERALIVRPQPDGQSTRLGFRALTGEQVSALERSGLEPALAVQVGDRYDVVLRVGAKLSEGDARDLRRLLTERFELPRTSGVFLDAVHLPGSRPDPRDEAARAHLVAVRHEPASASERWVAEMREARERAAVVEKARALEIDTKLDRAPALAANEALREQPQLPEAGYLSHFHRQVLEVRANPGPSTGIERALSDQSLVNSARADTRRLPEVPGHLAPEHDARLLGLEAEIRRRGNAAFLMLQRAERELESAAGRVEATRARAEGPKASPRYLGAHRKALRDHAQAASEHGERARDYARWLFVKASLDRERFAIAFTDRPRAETFDALREAFVKEVRLERQAGGQPTPELAPRATRPQLEEHLRGLDNYLGAARAKLAELPEPEIATVEMALREREVTRLALGQEALRREPATREALEQAAGQDGRQAVSAFFDYRSELASRAALEAQLGSVATVARDRLPEAAGRVARGDLSPEALRQLNGSLVALDGAGSVRLPAREAAGEPREWVARFVQVEREIRQDAAALQKLGAQAPAELRQRLLAHASEAVGIHQRLERLQRTLLQVADPGKAPEGISPSAWKTAWLLKAVEKGLSPDLAASQLGNLAKAPALASSLIPGGKALGASLMAVRFAAGLAYRHVERVLRH